MFDFFVSYSSADEYDLVNGLVKNLHDMGYSVWYDKNEILAGDNISLKIKEGLSNSYCLLLVMSKNFIDSKWVFYEMGTFETINSSRIIPLVYDISEIDKELILKILGNKSFIDMNVLKKEEISELLLRTLSKIKKENNDLCVIDKLTDIQRRLATYETVNLEIVSIKLKEYLELLENHNDFVLLAAKQIAKTISNDLLTHAQYHSNSTYIDQNKLINLLDEYKIGSVNFREHIKFLFNQNIDDSSVNGVTITNNALLNILNYYINTKYPVNLSSNKVEVVFPDDLNYNDFLDMYEIDKKVMRADLIADINTAYGWFEYNKYTHIAVRDVISKRTVGYFAFLPVTEETYNKIICGDFQDKDFTADAIEQYIFPDFYKVYIAGVGIDPEYQNTGAFIKLYNSLIDLFLLLANEREIYISEILAEASTKQGEKFCKMVGMKRVTSTKNDTDIYRLITIPPEFRLRNHKGKELYNLCKRKFEEYKDFFESN